ncbi:hypothetical protein FACS1894166_10410 [Bacilli bacterium]|nr:hypothetical protein FACS1894166_10410 [Bacilli bacterium]
MSGARPILMNYAFDQKTKKQLIKSVRPKLIIDQVLANQLLKLLKITSKEINFNAN